MNLDEFKIHVLEKEKENNKKEKPLIVQWNELKKEQEKYGTDYIPIETFWTFLTGRMKCPVCKSLLHKIYVTFDEESLEDKFMLTCKKCKYAFAYSKNIFYYD